MCPEQDSNLHVVKHTHLKRARLPIPPPGHKLEANFYIHSRMSKSGKRDSNSRPRPWQGRALPTELLPHLTSLFLQRVRLSRGDRIRTCGRLVPNQERYRAALRPVAKPFMIISFLNCECKGSTYFRYHQTFPCFFSIKIKPFLVSFQSCLQLSVAGILINNWLSKWNTRKGSTRQTYGRIAANLKKTSVYIKNNTFYPALTTFHKQ